MYELHRQLLSRCRNNLHVLSVVLILILFLALSMEVVETSV
jgi:hypothetical protein